jgi:hypothetical protein
MDTISSCTGISHASGPADQGPQCRARVGDFGESLRLSLPESAPPGEFATRLVERQLYRRAQLTRVAASNRRGSSIIMQ